MPSHLSPSQLSSPDNFATVQNNGGVLWLNALQGLNLLDLIPVEIKSNQSYSDRLRKVFTWETKQDNRMSWTPIPVWEIGEYKPIRTPGGVKPKVFPSLPSLVRTGQSDIIPQCQDNVTEWDIRSWCWQTGIPVWAALQSRHECVLSQVGTSPDMTVDVVYSFLCCCFMF